MVRNLSMVAMAVDSVPATAIFYVNLVYVTLFIFLLMAPKLRQIGNKNPDLQDRLIRSFPDLTLPESWAQIARARTSPRSVGRVLN